MTLYSSMDDAIGSMCCSIPFQSMEEDEAPALITLRLPS